jgi:hypothetical protein
MVPQWDEHLFPLNPPQAFVSWLDPLPLDERYNVVDYCTNCGGRGWVTRTETYSEYVDGKYETRTREVQETCSVCAGTGYLEYQQVLNTQWQTVWPAATAPDTPMAEFFEGAEERVYYRMRFVEDREEIHESGQGDGIEQDLADDLDASAQRLRSQYEECAEEVERLHDGIVYRADFQVTGFWTLCIHFSGLPGKVGWFFGKRPEFYFPRLPLSLSKLGTLIFLGPLGVIGAGFLVFSMSEYLPAVLP